MAKFTKELAKLFRKITNSEIDAEGNAHVVLFPADSLLINNARIALASLEAEAVAYMHHSGQVVTREECCDDKIFAICCKVETPLYAAPQLPQPAVPDMAAVGEMPFLGTQENAFVSGWNACRAAMLQAGNHAEQHLDMVDHSGDSNEKADCRLPFAHWLSQQNEPIDVDCGCVSTEAFYHWLRVAYEAGKSPVTPDGWQLVPKEPTEAMNKAGWAAMNEHDAINPTYRAMLAAAPQQEVKSALEHGMQRYAGAMQKLSEGDK